MRQIKTVTRSKNIAQSKFKISSNSRVVMKGEHLKSFLIAIFLLLIGKHNQSVKNC